MTLKAYRPNQLHSQDQASQALVPDLRERLESFPKPDFVGSTSKLKKTLGVLFVICSVSAISYLTYSAFKYSTPPANIEEVPLVRADIGPVKTIPADPGGTQFENQDKLIYKNLEDPNLKTAKSEDDGDIVKKDEAQLRTPPVVAKKAKIKKDEAVAKQESANPSTQEAKAEPTQKPEEKVATPKVEPKSTVVAKEEKPKTVEKKPEVKTAVTNKKESKPVANKDVDSTIAKKKVAKQDAYQPAKPVAIQAKESISASDLEKKIDAEIENKSTAKAQATPTPKAKEEITSPFDLLDNAQ